MSNSMLDILRNFEAAEKGEKPGVAGAAKNEMRSILESFHKVNEATVEECGGMEMAAPMASEGQPVTVNITASGKENVSDLMALLKMAGVESPQPVPGDSAQDADMAAMRQAMMAAEEEIEEKDYINEPDEEYRDHNFMTKDLSGGINRRKKQYKPAADGDNPMAVESIKEQLWAALNEKKMSKKGCKK